MGSGKGVKFRVRGSVGVTFRVGNRFRYNIAHFSQPVANSLLPTQGAGIIESSHLYTTGQVDVLQILPSDSAFSAKSLKIFIAIFC